MNSQKTATILEDAKINVKIKLSALWAALMFLFIYVAIGFFIINSLLYLFLYLSINTELELIFVNVYIGSRVALIGMMISFVIFFYQWNKIMRRTDTK